MFTDGSPWLANVSLIGGGADVSTLCAYLKGKKGCCSLISCERRLFSNDQQYVFEGTPYKTATVVDLISCTLLRCA